MVGTHYALLQVSVPLSACKVLATGSRREVSEASRRVLINADKGPALRARAVVLPL